ncbi:hypothetical protein PENSPDRAFT_687199 [Peniophora sp. CONT]|nr:hypothetical protein PENSPDRAFT_687199 [Peniophora sp. CONT]
MLVSTVAGVAQKSQEYDYIGGSYPLELPVAYTDTVAMTLHETVRFSLNASDVDGDTEWHTTAVHPRGSGRVRLGSDHRIFVTTFYHQIHCLRKMQVAIIEASGAHADGADPIATPMHTLHCLNYLRQTLLCEAADSLEEGDFMTKDFERDTVHDTLICRDWEALFAEMSDNFETWANGPGGWA